MYRLPIIFVSIAMLMLTVSSAVSPDVITLSPSMSDTIPPLSFPGCENAVIGLYIEDINTGEAVAEYGSDRPMCPASIMKVVTSASVLSLYPESERFITKVNTMGNISAGVLSGDIIIEASGDPTLASEFFDAPTALQDSIISALRALGVDSVAGMIRINSRAIPDPSYPPGWSNDDYMWPYGAMLRAFNWRDNRYTLEIPSKISTPHIPDLTVNFTRRRRGKLKWDAVPPLTTVYVVGKAGKAGASARLAMPDPAAAFLYSLNDVMADSGIVIGNNPVEVSDATPRELTAVTSPAFPDILQSLMHRSDNLMAEGMIRTLAPMQPLDTAASRELDLWNLRGADTDSVVIIDGSGLSRQNRLTTWFLADVMAWMARSPRADEYIGLFPVVGREGTVRRFLEKTPLEGKMALKTGTMSGVRALAGFKLDDDGKPTHSVVLIVNGYTCSQADVNAAAAKFFLNFFSTDGKNLVE